MIHLTEEMILAVRDREPVADEVVAHLDECATCARALEDARARSEAVEKALAALTVPLAVDAAVERLAEHPPGPASAEVAGDPAGRDSAWVIPIGRGRGAPAAGPGSVEGFAGRGRRDAAAGSSGPTVPIGRGRRDAHRGTRARAAVWTMRWLGRAAVLVLIGAGALSALPGPFNGWIPRMFQGSPQQNAAPASEESALEQVGGRMAVSSGPLVVRLENAAPGTVIEVRRVASASVGVLAGTGSEFSYGSGEVRASVVAGPVTVELPEAVVPATLIVNGSVYLVVNAAGMEVPGPATAVGGEGLATFRVRD